MKRSIVGLIKNISSWVPLKKVIVGVMENIRRGCH